jgi:HlyD family secretion protein
VLSRAVEPGQIVQPGRNLITLALAGPTQLVAQVDERFLEQLRVGQPAYAVADAYPGQRFAASILSIAPTVDAQRGSIEVKFTLRDALPAFLREDMTLSVEVETGRRERTLALPVAALATTSDPARASARVVVDGRVQERMVQLGLRTLQAVEVTSGLAEGDVVALDPALPAGRTVQAVVQPLLLMAPAKAGAGGAGGAALTNAMGR